MGEHRFSYPTVIELRRHVAVAAELRGIAAAERFQAPIGAPPTALSPYGLPARPEERAARAAGE